MEEGKLWFISGLMPGDKLDHYQVSFIIKSLNNKAVQNVNWGVLYSTVY